MINWNDIIKALEKERDIENDRTFIFAGLSEKIHQLIQSLDKKRRE